ncbi:2-succinyl-5-enolpyruvyl-6-hydroxy-3-cyclohexene-1-carboxylic-acid synthase [Subtercola sp. YIM 133946]|uniref:2-succinyl-5-enolpyruvyl-6-hydroxy-3- cyclohexene-1-carboxylic-acid synthase n=1 Tax=Subtercola sp. YIM 133946 TaxID=3118909 RepID=UPI002F9475EB
MTAAESPAADFSLALLSEFIELGLTDAVLSPGSRSQALALALAEFDRVGMLDLQVRIDERSAGFTALGLAVETARPAVVVTTSGTAVANLLPAVLEASHSNVPMLLLTSDRPDELRATGSNQTTWQAGIFGRFVRAEFDVQAPVGAVTEPARAHDIAAAAWAAATGASTGSSTAGPVHVNLQFREPLSTVVPHLPPGAPHAVDATASTPAAVLELERGPRTIVIAGHGAGPAAEELAHEGGWPLLAEPSSGSRFGRNLVVAYRQLLAAEDFGGRVERAIVFGHPSLSREVPLLLRREGVEVIVVGQSPDDVSVFNPAHRAAFAPAVRVAPADDRAGAAGDAPTATDEPSDRAAADRAAERDWLRSWAVTSRALLAAEPDDVAPPNIEAARSRDIAERREYRVAELSALRASITRRMLALAVWRATWPHDRLVLGASRLIRDLDQAAPGKKIIVHANRGLAGIDGTIATASGIALASQRGSELAAQTGVTRVLIGDLTLLHDVGSMLLGSEERRPRIHVIVGNDGGGTIFDTLEVAATADRAAFDRVMMTPHTVDLAALAAAYGWSYARASTRSELDRELTSPITGPTLLEVALDR